MNPQPLLRILANPVLERRLEGLGILRYVAVPGAGSLERDLGTVLDDMLAGRVVPPRERGNHRGSRPERQLRDSLVCGGGHPEELDEDRLLADAVLICEDPNGAVVGQNAQHFPRGTLLGDDRVSVRPPESLHQSVDAPVRNRTDENGKAFSLARI